MDIKTQILKEAEKRVPILTEEEYYKDDVDDPYYDYRVLRQYQQLLFREGAEWLDTEIVQPLRMEVEKLESEQRITESQLIIAEGRAKELEEALEAIRILASFYDCPEDVDHAKIREIIKQAFDTTFSNHKIKQYEQGKL